MIAADHSQCQKKHDKLLPYNSWLAGWLDGLFTQDTEYSKVKVMIPFSCLPACPACLHASIYKEEEELIIRLIIVHTTRIIMHQHLKMMLGFLTVVVVVPEDLSYSRHQL